MVYLKEWEISWSRLRYWLFPTGAVSWDKIFIFLSNFLLWNHVRQEVAEVVQRVLRYLSLSLPPRNENILHIVNQDTHIDTINLNMTLLG